jgi:hypothetical protein
LLMVGSAAVAGGAAVLRLRQFGFHFTFDSLAVMPIDSAVGGGQNFLGGGLTDAPEAQVPGLRVMVRNAVYNPQLRTTTQSPPGNKRRGIQLTRCFAI